MTVSHYFVISSSSGVDPTTGCGSLGLTPHILWYKMRNRLPQMKLRATLRTR